MTFMQARRGAAMLMLAAVGLSATTVARATGIPVVDGAAIAQNMANHLEAVAKFVEQIAMLRDQLETARRQYDSITGARGFGDIIDNPAIRRSMPDDVQKLWRVAESTYRDLSYSIERIRGDQRLSGRYSVDREGLAQRVQEFAEMAKVLGERAYEGADMRQQQIDDLQQRINTTQDTKGIAELQARLAVEGQNVGVAALRVLVLQQQTDAEQRLIAQQENALAQRAWFDTSTLRGPARRP